MDNYTIRFVFDRKNETGFRKKEKGKEYKERGLLQIEVKEDGSDRRVWISANVKIKPDQFSNKNGFACRNDDNAKNITGKAHNIFRKIQAFVESDQCKSLADVKFWDNPQSNVYDVISFVEKEMTFRNMQYSTLKAHITLKNKLEDFKYIKQFKDLTYTNISAFDNHMRSKGLSNVSINKMHTLFNMYIREALKKDYINKNPYDQFTKQKAKSAEPVYLTQEEVLKIVNLIGLNDKLEKTKDLFLFQCYTGLAYTDMQLFNKNDIQLTDGKEIIRSSRIKTDESFILLFLPIAKEIAEKYNYQLPRISNQKYNDYLKLLVAHPDVNINKKVTTHTARHTFATYLINKGVPLETVSKILGHSNIKQTQHYARLLAKKVISDMESMLLDEQTAPIFTDKDGLDEIT